MRIYSRKRLEKIRMERWLMELKDRVKRFYNNINSKSVETMKNIEGIVAAIMHNMLITRRRNSLLD
ncbi:MAG: hypothetical protein QXP74_06705 [Nitrososphaerota archaeon]